MIHLFVWPLLVAAFVTEKPWLKKFGFISASIAHVLSVLVGANILLHTLIAVGFHWIFAWGVAAGIKGVRARKSR